MPHKSVASILVLFFLLTVCMVSFGCGSQERSPAASSETASLEVVTGDAIVVSSIGDAKRLNPIIANDSASGDINGQIFNGLIRYDKDLLFEGELAESWDISDDGLVITFHLRPGVLWHDGLSTSRSLLAKYS